MKNNQYYGIIPPMVTPLEDWDKLDYHGIEKLINHILKGGVHGLFVLGTTGEAPSLSHQLRKEVIKRTLDQVGTKVPVLVGITDTSFIETINIAEFAAEAGASAVVLAPPYYFPAGQFELIEYIEHLVQRLPLPLFLYNMPTHTKMIFEPETVKKASELPGVIGLKDSSGNMVYFHHLQQLFRDQDDFKLFVGPFILKLTPKRPSPVFFPIRISPRIGIFDTKEFKVFAGISVPRKLKIFFLLSK